MPQSVNGPSVAWVLFSLRGRIARQSYILGISFMLSLFAVVVARILAVRGDEIATEFWGLAFIVLGGVSAWSMIALTVKRLHDLGLPGALVLILFVPTVDLIFAAVLMFLPSKQETNEHGPPPFGPAG
ncbi:MAG: DUF805 domain-containing protein [Nitratireductor sp.]|nr:DUF805 domain-containing protein [Nitratireductor sp.]